MWPRTFQEAFCLEARCSPEEYESKVFWRCLHRRALPLSALLFRINPTLFDVDIRTIRQLGVARSFEEFCGEVDSFRSENRRHGGFLRRQLYVRVSGRRLMALALSLPPDMPVGRKSRHTTSV
jgi:hypothetical protein